MNSMSFSGLDIDAWNDDGGMVCGGSGFLLGKLTLATSYRSRDHERFVAANSWRRSVLVRPVLDLD